MLIENGTFLKQFPFEEELHRQIAACRIETFEKSEIIIRQYSYIKFLPLLLNGNIRVYRQTEDREILLYYIEKESTCCMTLSSCLNQTPIHSELIATKTSEVLLIPTSKVIEWQKYSSWNNFIISTFSKRQEQLVEIFDELAFSKIDKRIKDYLNTLSKANQNPNIPITHQELANELGTTRVVISRILKAMEIKGAIELLRGSIKIINLRIN